MAATKKYVDDNSSGAASVRCTVRLTSDQTITASSTEYISWDVAPIEEGAVWDIGAPTRLTIPETGDYLIGGVIEASEAVGDGPEFDVIIREGGSTVIHTRATTGFGYGATIGSVSFSTMYSFTAAEYVEIGVTAVTAQNHDVKSGAASTRIWIMKVG